mmetsp:Transcript_66705/g.159163  ORF Transcript_66705/g.159163 Transcript_66705/m.159163 type:complete len:366 (+) Transcript_66705:3-1100(+)
MGGGGGGRPKGDNTKFYKLLDVEPDADEGQLKKAYKKVALKNHPDKGGDPEKFKEISNAYEVLSDPEKRKIYDQYGEEALQNGGGEGMGDPMDIFNSFFGGGGMGGQQRKRKTQDVMHKLTVPLEELYCGTTKKLALNRHFADSKGRVTKKKEVLEVRIDRGMDDGKKIVFKEKADEMPGAITGDVILVIAQAPHARFKRHGPHLTMEKSITLKDALCGFEFAVQHLDKRQVVVASPPGQVTQPGSWISIPGEGMPIKGNQFNKGNLFIHITVQFPKKQADIPPGALKVLADILPGSPKVEPNEDQEEHVGVACTEEEIIRQLKQGQQQSRQQGQQGQQGESSEEEGGGSPFGGGGGQQVQCQQS